MQVPANEKPIVAVMDSESYFNITRGATFTDIIFRGDYGLLRDRSSSGTKQMIKSCEIDESEESEFTKYKPLAFTSATKNNCVETGFQEAVLFNLFNFDLETSRYNPALTIPIVSLTLNNCEFKYFLDAY